MASIADVFFKALLDDSQLQVDAKRAGDKLGTNLGSRVTSGLKKTVAGAALGGLFTSAIESASKFDDQLRTINTVAKVSDEALNQIGDSIQQLSRDSGKTTDDLTAGFYDLVSAGVPADQAITVLRDSAVLATGALGSTAEAVDLVTSAMGAYGLEADQSTRVTDIFAQAVADGKTTVADLAGGISQVAPIAASAGVSLEEVAAATAVMTLKGDTASQAMTRIKNAISALLTPNLTLNQIQEKTGVNFAKLAADKGLAVALDELRKATKGNNEEFAKALGSSEALTLAFSVTGDNAEAMATELGKIEEGAAKGGVALGQYTEKSKSATEQGKRLVANVQTFLQDVGGPFVSTMGPAIFALNQFGQAFGAGGVLAKGFGAAIGALTTKAIPAFTFFWKNVALGATAVFASALDLAIGAGAKIWRTLANSSAVSGVLSTLGKAWGTTLGKAIGVAAGALIVAQLLISTSANAQAIAKHVKTLQKQMADAFSEGNIDLLRETREGLQAQLEELASVPFPGLADQLLQKQLAADIAKIDARLAQETAKLNQTEQAAHNAGLSIGSSVVDGVAESDIGGLTRQIIAGSGAAWAETARQQGNRLGFGIAQGITEKREAVDDAWLALLEAIKKPISATRETAKLLGRLVSTKLIEGLKSSDPAVRAQARATKQLILDRLAELRPRAGTLSKDAMEAVKRGMKSKDPQIRAASTAIYNAAISGPKGLTVEKGKTWGANIGKGLAAGLNAQATAVGTAAGNLAGIISDFFKTGSPSKAGPLSKAGGPDGWGEHFTESFAEGIARRASAVLSAANAVAQAATLTRPMDLGYAVPSMGVSPTWSPSAVVAPPVASGGDTFQLSVLAAQPVQRPIEIVRELRIRSQQGYFGRRR